MPFQSSESGQLTDKEHKDALDSILPLCNERVRRRLFLEAEKAVMMDGVLNAVPIMRLARILCSDKLSEEGPFRLMRLFT